MEYNTFWKRVKAQIKAHRYSQEKLAGYIGIPVQTLWGWIHYDRIPDAVTACDIARAMGVTVEYLVSGGDDTGADDKMQRTFSRKTAAEQIKKLSAMIGEATEDLRL